MTLPGYRKMLIMAYFVIFVCKDKTILCQHKQWTAVITVIFGIFSK